MKFVCTHIYREGNACANQLAGHGTSISDFVWCVLIPSFIVKDFFNNRLGLPWIVFFVLDSVFPCRWIEFSFGIMFFV